jgi:hypothetical protein
MILTRQRHLVAATALMLTYFPLCANVLLPGDTNVSPDVFADPGNPPILGDLTGTFNFGSGVLIGHWEEVVLVDPFSTPTVCAGCLDFAFQITVDSSAAGAGIFSANLARFFGYTTDVGYVTNSGAVAPNSVSRGSFGGGVTFLFNTADSAIGLGRVSDFVVVATNATTYDRNGSLGIAGGDSQNPNLSCQFTELFEPTFVAPEPASWALMLAGATALGLMRRRR